MVDSYDPIKTRELHAGKFAIGAVTTPILSDLSLGATNWTTIASIDCNAASNDQLSDMVGHILTVLHSYGMCQGAVTA